MPIKKETKPKVAASRIAQPKSGAPKIIKPKTASTKTKTNKAVISKPVKLERTDVFVSYSHTDKKWLTEMKTHLVPLGREHGINIWDDTRIQSGDKWRTEIDKALAKSKVAILLVSARFMASAFIADNELPPLLKAAEKEGLIILTVIVGRTGAFTNHPISVYQAVNGPSEPLNLLSDGQVDEVFSQLYSRILNIFVSRPLEPTQRPTRKADKSAPKKDAVSVKTEVVTGKQAITKKATTKKRATPTTNSHALLVKRNGDWMVVPVTHGSVSTEIRLELHLSSSVQRAFVSSLRQSENLGSIVYRSQTHFCKSQDIQMSTTGTKEVWHLKATLQSINRRADVTYGTMKPEKQAELTARLLLLDESPSNEPSPFGYFSNHTQINGGQSPLPVLYQQFAKQVAVFKQTAPLIIIWFLQTNSIVDHIHKLTFSLKGDTLTVRFQGERSSQYQNEAPAIINVEGTCNLSKPVDQSVLRLGSSSRY